MEFNRLMEVQIWSCEGVTIGISLVVNKWREQIESDSKAD